MNRDHLMFLTIDFPLRCKKLFDSLKEDLERRAPYIAYLVRCRQGLLSTLAHLERLSERVKCDSQVRGFNVTVKQPPS